MEAVEFSRKLVNIYQIVLCHMLKDHSFHIHYHENLKSHIVSVLVLQVIGPLPKSQSQSQSHIATDGQSVSLSWCRAPSGAHDQIFILPWKLLSCPYGARSLTRSRVCHLSVIVTCFSQLSVVKIFTILQILNNCMYNIYKASVSPGLVQQTMPYF
jgi:hypothetical protein